LAREAPSIRPARDDDAQGVIELIGGVFAEYPGVLFLVDEELPELRRIASWAGEHDGEFWVAERQGRIVGTCGYTRAQDPAGFELKKLYVHSGERESGLGSIFAARAESRARERGGRFLDLWSDTRFTTAHRFYERRGYVRGTTRDLGDKSNTVEFYFRKELV
jgi:N-acetylglutamate synthase-like GNAT family acetyltransferase